MIEFSLARVCNNDVRWSGQDSIGRLGLEVRSLIVFGDSLRSVCIESLKSGL